MSNVMAVRKITVRDGIFQTSVLKFKWALYEYLINIVSNRPKGIILWLVDFKWEDLD